MTGSAGLHIERVEHDGGAAYLASTPVANWILLRENDDLTLIDGGYPGQAGLVTESIERIGARPEDIRGALLTHAHVDHIGGLAKLERRYRFPVYADPDEVGHARREYLQQASPAAVARAAVAPRVLRWLAQVTPLGVLSRTGIDATRPFPRPLDLPGRPQPVPAHGHTDGHSAFLVADGSVLVSGDALVGGHPISAVHGAQCIPGLFQHDAHAARDTVEAFTSLDAATLFPGHGPRLDGGVAAAARCALDR